MRSKQSGGAGNADQGCESETWAGAIEDVPEGGVGESEGERQLVGGLPWDLANGKCNAHKGANTAYHVVPLLPERTNTISLLCGIPIMPKGSLLYPCTIHTAGQTAICFFCGLFSATPPLIHQRYQCPQTDSCNTPANQIHPPCFAIVPYTIVIFRSVRSVKQMSHQRSITRTNCKQQHDT
jgi:hypothetical protein